MGKTGEFFEGKSSPLFKTLPTSPYLFHLNIPTFQQSPRFAQILTRAGQKKSVGMKIPFNFNI
jgi:hypothetical protein